MIIILLVLLFSPIISDAYEIIWETEFLNENGYGYDGAELYLPTEEWSIDLQGASLSEDSTPDWFKVSNGVLEGRDYDCSSQLNTTNTGVLWKSRIITLDNNKTYLVDFSLETSNNWDISSIGVSDFVRIGYIDDNHLFKIIYEKTGITERCKISDFISNTTECQLIIEVDSNSNNEIFKLFSVNLYYDTSLGDSSELIITKLCSPATSNYNNRYIQITNAGNHIIDLSPFTLESIYQNNVLFSWLLTGLILPSESLVIGDVDATEFFCHIGKSNWSSRSVVWEGIPSNHDGAQLVINNVREVTDRVVGVNFFEGYTERNASNLLATQETNTAIWNFFTVSSAADSHPGEYLIDETLPISFYSTEFSWNNSGYLFSWTTYGESNLIGYNLYFSEVSQLSNSIKINPEIISAQNSLHYNAYSFSLAEIESDGYLWLEVISFDEPSSFSQPFNILFSNQDFQDTIEIVQYPEVTLFPNPSSHDSFIKVRNSSDRITEISVFNIKGQLVGKIKSPPNSDIYDIQSITNKLSSGIYFVSSKLKTKIVTKKLILTK